MSYSVQQIGITGPSANIGGSSEYHIDTKFSNKLSIDQIRDRFDAIASKYKELGRSIEFSNQGVAGSVYDLNASPEERSALLQRAAGAHAPREGYLSFDYYAPTVGNNRFHKSAEGAPIFVAGAEGLKIEGGSGGGYGNYAAVIGADGQVLSKSGHGDNRQAAYGGGVFGGGASISGGGVNVDVADATGQTISTPQQEAVERVQQYKANTAEDVVKNFGNDFGSMKSNRLGDALAGAQQNIIQKRMDNGESFGGKMVETTRPKKK